MLKKYHLSLVSYKLTTYDIPEFKNNASPSKSMVGHNDGENSLTKNSYRNSYIGV